MKTPACVQKGEVEIYICRRLLYIVTCPPDPMSAKPSSSPTHHRPEQQKHLARSIYHFFYRRLHKNKRFLFVDL